MKRKNVKLGSTIVAKNNHGGADMGAQLVKGRGYEVTAVECEPYRGDLFCTIKTDADTYFWVDPKHFRKSC